MKAMDSTNNSHSRPSSEAINNWWKNVLKSPMHIVAPMVDASELPWRMLCRRYNSHLCFTPMIHSKNFVKDVSYRNEHLNSCKCMEDRPLIIQFCGNDPKIIAEAALYAKDYCDGIDINLGCPQKIAKTGHYGAFLQDEWELVASMVQSINMVGIPVSCKIRVFEDVEKTVRYAKMIETAGCWMLTVHGRTITQKGNLTGLADWSHIKAVRDAVSIPVIANGNIQYLQDVQKCIDATGVNAVMSAEGNLHNPAIFSGLQPPVWDVAFEYIQLAKVFPCPISYARGHLFKIFHHLLMMDVNFDLRESLGKAGSMETFDEITHDLKGRYQPYFLGVKEWIPPDNPRVRDLPFPPWICQPYERPPPPTPTPMNSPPAVKETNAPDLLDNSGSALENRPSKKSLKRMKRKVRLNSRIRNDPKLVPCLDPECHNISGSKCDFKLCKICCKVICNEQKLDCEGHRIFAKSGRGRTTWKRTNSELEMEVTVTPD